MAPLSYREAQKVLEQQKLAEEVLKRYDRLKGLHEQHGFQRRRDLIRVLEDIEAEERRGARGPESRSGRGLSAENIARIRQLKAEGHSNAEISRRTGASPITIAKYVGGQRKRSKATPRSK